MEGLYEATAQRLRDRCPALLQVATGMDANELVETLAIGPDVTVLITPLGDRADPVGEAGLIVSQREVWRLGATLVLTFPGGFSQFEPARDQMKAALRGWSPVGSSMPMQYAGSRLLQYSASQDGGRWMTLFEFNVPTQATYEHQA
jgi:hypothetical protein